MVSLFFVPFNFYIIFRMAFLIVVGKFCYFSHWNEPIIKLTLTLQTRETYTVLIKCCLTEFELHEANIQPISGTEALKYLLICSFPFSLGLPCNSSTLLNYINSTTFTLTLVIKVLTSFLTEERFNEKVLNFWVARVFCYFCC